MAHSMVAFLAIVMCVLVVPSVQTDIECDMCRKVTDIVERVLVMNSTDDGSFRHISKKMCMYLPANLGHTCTEGVRKLDPAVFRCMIQELELHTVCSDPVIGLCRAPARPLGRVRCSGMEGDPFLCSSCKFVAGGMRTFSQVDMADTLASIRGICEFHFSDEASQKKCDVLVKLQGERIVKLLTKRFDAEDFCCDMGLCRNPPVYESSVPAISLPDEKII